MAKGSYNKTDAAKSLGISKKEFENRAKSAGFDNTEAYYNFIGGASAPIIEQITEQIIALDRQLDSLGPLGLTDAEKENFLSKAIEQVQPFYDRKTQEIEAGISEGRLRTAEDVLLFTRDIQNEVQTTLASLDLRSAETEEDFLNIMSEITSGRDENVGAKREEWRLRLENTKMEQIRGGIFSSGIGRKKREEVKRLEEMETGTIEAQAARRQTDVETARKYDLDQIRLAREASERDRAARIGAPETREALETTGLTDISQLGSRSAVELARKGEARDITTYRPEALQGLEEQRLKGVESRKLEFQEEELSIREQEYQRKRQKVLADKAAAQSRLSTYRR